MAMFRSKSPSTAIQKDLETTDQKEIEIHKTQLKLMREQSASFIADLAALKQQVEDLQSGHYTMSGTHNSMAERVDFLEKTVGDSAAKHAAMEKSHQGHAGAISTVEQRVGYLEKLLGDSADKHAKEIAALKDAHSKQMKDLDGLKNGHAKHATFEERLIFIEKSIGDSADKHMAEIEKLRAAHGKHAKGAESTANELKAMAQSHGSIQQRVGYLEQTVGDDFENHKKELEELKGSHKKFLTDFKDHGKLLGELQKSHCPHATFEERMGYIEKLLGDSADKHNEELQALKNAHGKHAKDFEKLKGQAEHHASFDDRISFLEAAVGDSADKHLKEIEAMKGQMSKHASALSEHAKLQGLFKNMEKGHAGVQERLKFIEDTIGDSAEKHAKELEALKQAHNDHKGASAKELSQLKSGMAAHASLGERVEYLEKVVGDSADKHNEHMAEIKALKENHNKSAAQVKELEKLKGMTVKHAAVEERIEYIEKCIGDSADKHAKALKALSDAHGDHAKKVQDLHHVIQSHGNVVERVQCLEDDVQAHWGDLKSVKMMADKHAGLAQQMAGDLNGLKQLGGHHATLAERVKYIEQVVGDSADKHEKAMQKLQQQQNEHASKLQKHASIEDRMKYVEDMLGDSADKHNAEIEALKAAHGKLAGDLAKHGKNVDGLQGLQQHHASMAERVGYLEKLMGDSADKHDAEIEALKKAHAKHAGDLDKLGKQGELMGKAHAHHATFEERIVFLEKMMGDSAEKHMAEIEAMRTAHGKHAGLLDQTAKDLQAMKGLAQSHGTLEQRIDFLEQSVGDSFENHKAEIAAIKASSSKLGGMVDKHAKNMAAIDQLHAHHAGVAERLDYIEKAIGDSADKHNAEIEAMKKAHAGHKGAMDKALAGLNGASSKHASFEERIEFLEKAVGDSADHANMIKEMKDANGKHAKALEALQKNHPLGERVAYLEDLCGDSAAKHDAAEAKLKEFQNAHGGHAKDIAALKDSLNKHATIAQRVDYLEQATGESADSATKNSKDMMAKHGSMEQRLSAVERALVERVAGLEEEVCMTAKLNDHVTATLQKELQTKEELAAELREAYNLKMRSGITSPQSTSAGSPSSPKSLFDQMDANHDGVVTRRELARFTAGV